jgi:hypothetical protein
MKTVRVIERTIKAKTGFKRYPFKNERQVTIIHGEKVFKNHYEDIDNPRLKIKFVETFKTRGKKNLQAYIDKLGRTDTEKWMKNILIEMLEG